MKRFILLAAALSSWSVWAWSGEEADYLRRKWRENLADMSTGLDAAALKSLIAASGTVWAASEDFQMVKARAFALLCEKTAIDVSEKDSFPTFARWTRHTTDLHPTWNLIHDRSGKIAAKKAPGIKWGGDGWWMYLDFDHSAPDWDDVLKIGFRGMEERLRANWKDDDFHRSRKIAMDGVYRLLDRLIAQGERRLKVEVDDGRVRLEQAVASLKRLRVGSPQTTLDALELIYLYFVMSENFEAIQVRTLGNLDRLLTPYYRTDLASGRITEAEFRDLLRHFWWQWGSMDNYWGQPVYFGGTMADGTTEYNEVSKILMEVHDELALPTPKVHLKIGKSTPDWFWRQSLEMMRRQRSLTFIGEEPHERVIRHYGYSAEEARTFAVWGCYEWAIRDSANDTCGGHVSLVRPYTRLLEDVAAGCVAAPQFEDFKREYLARTAQRVVEAREGIFKLQTCLSEVNPSMLFSLATDYSMKTGKDAFAGGMRRGNNTGIWMIGLGTTVDALMATKELLYGVDGRLTPAELNAILAQDWKGHEALRLRMLRSKCKWGNNDPEANALAVELSKVLARNVNGIPNSRGGFFKLSGHSARGHYDMGRQERATPDGRHAKDEFSKNIAATMGADTEGATALLASYANLDPIDFPGDFPCDMALLPSAIAGEKGLLLMRTLIERYFANNGLVIHFNVVGAETLKDAQTHPEKYENLQVRVCGWNVRWNDIPKREQDAFIRRAENLAR